MRAKCWMGRYFFRANSALRKEYTEHPPWVQVLTGWYV